MAVKNALVAQMTYGGVIHQFVTYRREVGKAGDRNDSVRDIVMPEQLGQHTRGTQRIDVRRAQKHNTKVKSQSAQLHI